MVWSVAFILRIYTTQYHIRYVKETLLVYVLELHSCSGVTTQRRPSALIRTGLNPFLLFLLISRSREVEPWLGTLSGKWTIYFELALKEGTVLLTLLSVSLTVVTKLVQCM